VVFNVNKETVSASKSFGACCGCATVMSVVLLLSIVLIVMVSSSAKVYEGWTDGITDVEVIERNNMHVEALAEYGVVLDVEDRSSNNLDDVIDKVLDSDKRMIDKVEALSHYGTFMSVHYVENDQAKISEFAELIKKDVEDGSFVDKVSDDRYILERAYMGRVVDASIPTDETNANLLALDSLVWDHFEYIKAFVRNDDRRMEANWDQLSRDVGDLSIPVVN